ncbi:hypothetical protein SRB5_36420 [Streptomyces sp. RB5]|uniref:Secreted protein n=1 Tax=Streptomyces smaragdinus TaxID=2585196 RepID=A0A7K0CL60_9ACTN|nr:hypothetical protein [Streptomyces smaragdinus]MQY13494.1 hypothetical protein [Streptomyces smaragdinus]
MSLKRSMTAALSTAAFVATLLTGATAQAADAPPDGRTTASSADTSQRIAAGRTRPGEGWQQYYCCGIYLDVDTSSAHFSGRPVYTSSIGGEGNQWELTGTSAIYSPTATGFRIYLRWSSGAPITPAVAADRRWYVNWIGVDNP